MNYLLDTNVISERLRPVPNEYVSRWLDIIPNSMLYISVLTIGEIIKGIEKLPSGNRKTNLTVWLEHDLPLWFEKRILPIDIHVAEKWGAITGTHPNPLPVIDGLLAATALVHDLVLVTRNVKDFQIPGISLFNPWEQA
jgi:predicted nucleic acid-binding protein